MDPEPTETIEDAETYTVTGVLIFIPEPRRLTGQNAPARHFVAARIQSIGGSDNQLPSVAMLGRCLHFWSSRRQTPR